MKAYVTSVDKAKVATIKLDDREILTTLGAKENNIAVQLQELFTAVTQSVSASLEVESQISVEITGSITLKAEGKAKFLVFNVGGGTEAAGSMKVVLSTTLKPKIEGKSGKSDDK